MLVSLKSDPDLSLYPNVKAASYSKAPLDKVRPIVEADIPGIIYQNLGREMLFRVRSETRRAGPARRCARDGMTVSGT